MRLYVYVACGMPTCMHTGYLHNPPLTTQIVSSGVTPSTAKHDTRGCACTSNPLLIND